MTARRKKPIKPCDDYKGVKYGLLSPDGKFYECGWHEHDALAFRVAGMSSSQACAQGWMMLTQHRDELLWYWGLEDYAHAFKSLTGEQVDTIIACCKANGCEFPEYLKEGFAS